MTDACDAIHSWVTVGRPPPPPPPSNSASIASGNAARSCADSHLRPDRKPFPAETTGLG